MLQYLLPLEWKAFFRSASFNVNIWIRIIYWFTAVNMFILALGLGVGCYFILEESELKPFETVNTYLIYYFAADLCLRFIFKKLPTANIRPLLVLNVKRKSLVHYFLGKSVFSIFNGVHLFLIIPFCAVLIVEGFTLSKVIFWGLSLLMVVGSLNFLHLLISNRPKYFYGTLALLLVGTALQYLQIIDIQGLVSGFFTAFYEFPLMVLSALGLLLLLYIITLEFYNQNLYLDAGFSQVKRVVVSEDFHWLNRFGRLSVFLKNDLRMIKRNKRPRTAVVYSFLSVFFGLLFFTRIIDGYDNDFMDLIAAMMVTAGFLINFGQLVPSWDSAYFSLLMCQNIKYRDYLLAKWWLMVMATVILVLISSFYLYFGWEVYALIVSMAIFNIGVNSYLTLWGGAFLKMPVNLEINQKIFDNQQAFDLKTILVSMPKILMPVLIYVGFKLFFGFEIAISVLAVVGLCGLAFRNRIFNQVEKFYKREKYDAIQAFKQKN
ncbi:DUF5687 family protein [Flavobacterium sp. JP2137]|uniref:DUF5687 family protein n=1 Tax=Flavobacterium sp. JP2137 TaxID=3414510 RepID=UPI003D2FA77A